MADSKMSSFFSTEEAPVAPTSPFGLVGLSSDGAGDLSIALSIDSAVCSVGFGSDSFELDGLDGPLAFFGGGFPFYDLRA